MGIGEWLRKRNKSRGSDQRCYTKTGIISGSYEPDGSKASLHMLIALGDNCYSILQAKDTAVGLMTSASDSNLA